MAPPTMVSARRPASDGSSLILANEFKDRPTRGYQMMKLQWHMPNEITCGQCDKPKNLRAYSDIQKQKYSEAKGNHYIICLSCNGPKKQEWTCCMCERTMGEDKFARSQRKKRDEAECYDCVHERTTDDDEGYEAKPKMIEGGTTKMIEERKTKMIDEKVEEQDWQVITKAGGKTKADQESRDRRWVAQAVDGIGNLDMGGQEWSDGEEDVEVEDSDSGSEFSI